MVVELGKQGKSLAQMAAVLEVDRASIWRWCDEHEEFCDAIARAKDYAMAWWEEQGQNGMWETPEGARLNPQLWSRSMAARFPDDYREQKRLEHTGEGGGAIAVTIATGVPRIDDNSDLA